MPNAMLLLKNRGHNEPNRRDKRTAGADQSSTVGCGQAEMDLVFTASISGKNKSDVIDRIVNTTIGTRLKSEVFVTRRERAESKNEQLTIDDLRNRWIKSRLDLRRVQKAAEISGLTHF